MSGVQRRFARRDVTAMAAAATVLPGAATFGLTDAPARASAAFQDTPTPLTGMSLVYVTGHGSVRVPPDMASAVIGIEVERPTLSEAQEEATTQATAIIDAIKAAGVADEDIRTTSFNVRIVRERDRDEGRGERGEVRGFQISNAVEVTVRALDSLGRVLDDAIAAGANEVRQIALSVSDPAAAATQARTRAVEDARAKADELAAAAGMSVSRVVTISEYFSPSPAPVEMATAIADGSEELSRAEVPIAIGSDEVVVEIEVTFELS
jgi:uncharacterized protein YggE